VAPVRIVFWKKWAQTEVHQTVDMSDPSNVRVDFSLVHSVRHMCQHITCTACRLFWGCRLWIATQYTTTCNARSLISFESNPG